MAGEVGRLVAPRLGEDLLRASDRCVVARGRDLEGGGTELPDQRPWLKPVAEALDRASPRLAELVAVLSIDELEARA